MKRRSPIKYDENKLYVFIGGITVSDQFVKEYGKKSITHICMLGADRKGANYKNGEKYNDFCAISLTLGKQILLPFDSFSSFLKMLNDKNIELFIFDNSMDFTLWFMKKVLRKKKFDPQELLEIFKEHFSDELGEIFRLYNDGIYFSQKVNTKDDKYGCDSCGWVYNDTDENKSFEELGKFFVCPDCGNKKVNFTKLN